MDGWSGGWISWRIQQRNHSQRCPSEKQQYPTTKMNESLPVRVSVYNTDGIF